MQAMLAAAEKTLRDLKDDKGNPRYPTTPLKQRPWALTVRTTSSNKWSNHADGRAIDLDPDTNPHLDNAAHRAIINELTGMDIEARNPGAALPLPPLLTPDSYDSVKLISDQFSANYTESGLTERSSQLAASRAALITERDGMKVAQADLAKQTKDVARQRDLAVAKKGATAAEKTAARDQAKTALKDIAAQQTTLKGRLAAKEKDVESTTKRADRIAAELRKFTREQKRFDATVAAVGAAEAAIGTDSTDLATATAAKDAADQALAQAVQAKKPKAEIAALRKELTKQVGVVSTAKAALRKHQKSLKDNAEERDRYTLRKYAREGILNLPKDVVEAMTKAGFTWGRRLGRAQRPHALRHALTPPVPARDPAERVGSECIRRWGATRGCARCGRWCVRAGSRSRGRQLEDRTGRCRTRPRVRTSRRIGPPDPNGHRRCGGPGRWPWQDPTRAPSVPRSPPRRCPAHPFRRRRPIRGPARPIRRARRRPAHSAGRGWRRASHRRGRQPGGAAP